MLFVRGLFLTTNYGRQCAKLAKQCLCPKSAAWYVETCLQLDEQYLNYPKPADVSADGAHRFKQESELGTILDPIADKLLMTSAFILLTMPNVLQPSPHLPIPFWVTAKRVVLPAPVQKCSAPFVVTNQF